MKPQYMALTKGLAKSLGVAAAIYLGCLYFGDFSRNQSSALAFLGWMGFELYGQVRASQQPAQSFSPFCVSIYPNWYPLLLDLKLIGGEEDWIRLCEEMNKVPATEYSVFRSGLVFTVISPPSEDGSPPGLTYSNNYKSFVTKSDFTEGIMKLEPQHRIGAEHPYFNHPCWAYLPAFYYKVGTKGYDIGLEVQHDWWKRMCEAGELGELAKVKVHNDYRCGTASLVIATVPFSEFRIYYQTYDQMKDEEEARAKQLEANGWTRQVERDAEITDPWQHIDHKYFAVAHRDI